MRARTRSSAKCRRTNETTRHYDIRAVARYVAHDVVAEPLRGGVTRARRAARHIRYTAERAQREEQQTSRARCRTALCYA
jgi:hypothetical protein